MRCGSARRYYASRRSFMTVCYNTRGFIPVNVALTELYKYMYIYVWVCAAIVHNVTRLTSFGPSLVVGNYCQKAALLMLGEPPSCFEQLGGFPPPHTRSFSVPLKWGSGLRSPVWRRQPGQGSVDPSGRDSTTLTHAGFT